MVASRCLLVLVVQLVAPALASVGLRGDRPWHPRLQRTRLPDGSATFVKISLRDSEEDGGDLPPSLLQMESSSSESNCPCKKEGATVASPVQMNAAPVQTPVSQSFIETAGTLTEVSGMRNAAKSQQVLPAPHVFTQVQQQMMQQQPQAQQSGLAANPFAPVNTDFARQNQMTRSQPVSFQQASQDSQASQPPGTATIQLTPVVQGIGPQNFQQVAAIQQQMQAEEVQLQNQMQQLQKMQQVPQNMQPMQQMQQLQQMPQQMMQQMPQLPQQMAFSQLPQQMPSQQMMEPMAFSQMPQQIMPQQEMQMQQPMAFPQVPQQMAQMPQQVPQMMQSMPQMMQQMPQMGQMQPMVFMEGVPPVQPRYPAQSMPQMMQQMPQMGQMQYMR